MLFVFVVFFIFNLCVHNSNACKFTPTGGKLVIATRLVIPNRTRYQSSSPHTVKEAYNPSSPSSPTDDDLAITEVAKDVGEFISIRASRSTQKSATVNTMTEGLHISIRGTSLLISIPRRRRQREDGKRSGSVDQLAQPT